MFYLCQGTAGWCRDIGDSGHCPFCAFGSGMYGVSAGSEADALGWRNGDASGPTISSPVRRRPAALVRIRASRGGARICSSRAHSHQPSQLHRLQSDAAAGRVSEFRVSKPDASVPHRENVGEETNQSRSWRNVGRGSIRNRSPGHSLTRFSAREADVFVQRVAGSPCVPQAHDESRVGLCAGRFRLGLAAPAPRPSVR
jgi:hypothetical protein